MSKANSALRASWAIYHLFFQRALVEQLLNKLTNLRVQLYDFRKQRLKPMQSMRHITYQ